MINSSKFQCKSRQDISLLWQDEFDKLNTIQLQICQYSIPSTEVSLPQRDPNLNLNIPSDAFETAVRAKTARELECPDIVDILAAAACNLVSMVGGPVYCVRLGRQDRLFSDASCVDPNLQKPTMPISQAIALVVSRGYTV
ncbi:unnamed protein product [Linum tenue]|uniref:peroxidase n=1 Tax=Linum tenue TaxID=586396 RepID=A0AAV0H3T9_9ROSI|nr:unnamed protein product [Linum tenue]